MTNAVPRLTLIVARDRHGGIGRDNTLPWHLPEDLQHFKATTLGHPIIMGRRTFDSIGRALPGRRNLVVSRNEAWAHEGCERVGSLAEALAQCRGLPEAFVIGGGQLYAEALPVADRLLITEVDLDARADTFFPAPDPGIWERTSNVPGTSRNGLSYAIGTWTRRPEGTRPQPPQGA